MDLFLDFEPIFTRRGRTYVKKYWKSSILILSILYILRKVPSSGFQVREPVDLFLDFEPIFTRQARTYVKKYWKSSILIPSISYIFREVSSSEFDVKEPFGAILWFRAHFHTSSSYLGKKNISYNLGLLYIFGKLRCCRLLITHRIWDLKSVEVAGGYLRSFWGRNSMSTQPRHVIHFWKAETV